MVIIVPLQCLVIVKNALSDQFEKEQTMTKRRYDCHGRYLRSKTRSTNPATTNMIVLLCDIDKRSGSIAFALSAEKNVRLKEKS
jgi:hypothetical protein